MGWEGMVGGKDGEGVREGEGGKRGYIWGAWYRGAHLQGHVYLNEEEDH
jgi:hypothetical protein